MQLTPVTCDHCGASIPILDSANFVTCRSCNSQLQVTRTDSTVSTRVFHQGESNSSATADEVKSLRRQTELWRLEQDWNERRRDLFIHGQSIPTVGQGVFAMVFLGGLGLIFACVGLMLDPSEFGRSPEKKYMLIAMGVFVAILGIMMGAFCISKANKYLAEEQDYQRRRNEILDTKSDGQSSRGE